MDGLPLHPALVHIPVGIAIVLPVAAIFVAVAVWNRRMEPKAWLLIGFFQGAALIGGWASMQTGEEEAGNVEGVVDESHIEEHEELAKIFMAITAAGTAVSIASLVLQQKNEKASRLLMVAAAALTVASAGAAVATGHKGGELVYRHGAAGAYALPPGVTRNPAVRPPEHEE